MIQIKKSEMADTRTCNFSKVTKDVLLNNSLQHIDDVQKGFIFLMGKMAEQAKMHDRTKIEKIDQFHSDFITGFEKKEWWEMHQKEERHHLKKQEFVQDDVNLIDVLEQIIDGIMAGLARSGKYRQEEIPPELLEKAYKNTVDLILKNVEVK